VDTLVEIKGYPVAQIGETGNNKNSRLTLNVKGGAAGDSINQVLFVNKYTPQVMIYPDTVSTIKNNTRLYAAFYNDILMAVDSSKADFWSAICKSKITLDTNYLMGYDSAAKSAQSVRPKPADSLVSPDLSWLQQVCTIVLNAKPGVPDTFIFLDTTHIRYYDFSAPIPAGIYNTIDTATCRGISVEGNPADSTVKVVEAEAYPNPTNPFATFRIAIPALKTPEHYLLTIYNVRGQLVRSLAKGDVGKTGMVRKIVWDGTDNMGTSVSSGVYYYRLNVGSKIRKGSLVMAR
jgi:hypothetical protein